MLTAIVTIAIFLVMISLHEFGHFAVSKLLGVKVNEFAIGMGPVLFKKQGTETLYSVRLLPIGGYCSLEGEDGESDNPRAFFRQKLWKRFLVVASGAILNILLGFVIFIIVSANSAPFATNRIAYIDENSNMYQSGVMIGDEITEINGKHISFYPDITLAKADLSPNELVKMTVRRDGKKLDFEFKLVENMLGFSPELDGLSLKSVLKQSYFSTKYTVKLVYTALGDIITGKSGLQQLSGPVGVVDAVNTAVKSDYSVMQVLFLTALLTINLGIFNLLPLPALDGGRLFFMLIELLRGKPVPPEKEGIVHGIGLMLLLAFALLISAKDIYMIFFR